MLIAFTTTGLSLMRVNSKSLKMEYRTEKGCVGFPGINSTHLSPSLCDRYKTGRFRWSVFSEVVFLGWQCTYWRTDIMIIREKKAYPL